MKKQIFWLLMVIPSFVFAQESYWKVERVKPVLQTGLMFEVALASITNADHILFNEKTNQLWFYSSESKDMKPALVGNSLIKTNTKAIKDGRIETMKIGNYLEILVYQNNGNIAFIRCVKAADNNAAFLKQVKASNKQ